MQPVCSGCERPAIQGYPTDDKDVTLWFCLDCSIKYEQMLDARIERDERHINYLEDVIADTYGVPRTGPKYPPRPPRLQVKGVTLNNIHIKDSTVGVVNTGSIQRVDVAIGALNRAGEEGVADAVRQLAEAIASTNDLEPAKKNDAMEMLGAIASEATQPAKNRRTAVMRPVLNAMIETIKTSAALASLSGKRSASRCLKCSGSVHP
jgi:hypothetical protein